MSALKCWKNIYIWVSFLYFVSMWTFCEPSHLLFFCCSIILNLLPPSSFTDIFFFSFLLNFSFKKKKDRLQYLIQCAAVFSIKSVQDTDSVALLLTPESSGSSARFHRPQTTPQMMHHCFVLALHLPESQIFFCFCVPVFCLTIHLCLSALMLSHCSYCALSTCPRSCSPQGKRDFSSLTDWTPAEDGSVERRSEKSGLFFFCLSWTPELKAVCRHLFANAQHISFRHLQAGIWSQACFHCCYNPNPGA